MPDWGIIENGVDRKRSVYLKLFKHVKKALPFVLAAVMIAALFPYTAFAANTAHVSISVTPSTMNQQGTATVTITLTNTNLPASAPNAVPGPGDLSEEPGKTDEPGETPPPIQTDNPSEPPSTPPPYETEAPGTQTPPSAETTPTFPSAITTALRSKRRRSSSPPARAAPLPAPCR